ncbi:hypothetical protein [Leifsonia sp. Leaf264]|uniref:hypothetical protein n=1 Tax=Leifsonia sp. Leaf264 TaxID=1736314 RepID=UPI0006F29149|nr:hypothetical protein [Leifsonia sp. Leaf264]KQO98607.1 hypothetical protein ASF30_11130 [Leifsonia sp. Leaf264]
MSIYLINRTAYDHETGAWATSANIDSGYYTDAAAAEAEADRLNAREHEYTTYANIERGTIRMEQLAYDEYLLQKKAIADAGLTSTIPAVRPPARTEPLTHERWLQVHPSDTYAVVEVGPAGTGQAAAPGIPSREALVAAFTEARLTAHRFRGEDGYTSVAIHTDETAAELAADVVIKLIGAADAGPAEATAADTTETTIDEEQPVATWYDLDRHRQKQDCSYRDAYKYFRTNGYDMAAVPEP